MARVAPGSHLGSFELLTEIGRGGAARVFRAKHRNPSYAELAYALKLLRPDRVDDDDLLRRFRREAYLLSMLRHPNIVATYDAGMFEGHFYIAMQFVNGRDLLQLLSSSTRVLPIAVAVHIAQCILRGLHFAHTLEDSGGKSLPVLHQDIKPSNVLVSFDGQVKITDFGVAAMIAEAEKEREEEDTVMGTRGYFAPEELDGDPVDHRADLYAASIILYELLAGEPLYDSQYSTELLRINQRGKVPKLRKLNRDVPRALERALMKGLQRNPAKRHETCQDMASALTPFAARPTSMPLAVTAVMRSAFGEVDAPGNHTRREQRDEIRKGRTGLALLGRKSAWLRPLGDAVLDLGAQVAAQNSVDELASFLAGIEKPQVLFVDVQDPVLKDPLLRERIVELRGSAPYPVALIACSEAMASDDIDRAYDLGARDILLADARPSRIVDALRAATRQIDRTQRTLTVSTDTSSATRMRLLFVSQDPELIARMSTSLMDRGYALDVSPNAAEATLRIAHANYDALIYDLPSSKGQSGAAIVDELRDQPGMGILPAVFLSPEDGLGGLRVGLPPRCSARRRLDSPVLISEAVQQLRSITHLGRTHLRYPVSGEVELHYGGQLVEGQCLDVSRGGARLRTQNIPSVGTMMTVRLPDIPTPFAENGDEEDVLLGPQLDAVVVRVEPPTGVESRVGLGVEFLPAHDATEQELARFITLLASQA